MRITIQDVNLAGKSPFEIWADKFGVKIKWYHADNGIFPKQYFRSEIEDSKQTITFYAVGYNHQNEMFEWKNSNSNTQS